MTMEQPYWDSVQECREMVEGLVLRTEQWIRREPEMQRLLELQNRAREWLSRLHLERPGIERRARRARLLYEGRSSRFTRVWEEKGAFAQEAQNRFDDLSTVLIRDEVERRKAQVNWADPVSILKALQSAAQRLEEFWQCRPGQSAAPTAGAGSGSRRKNDSAPATKKRGEYRQQDEDDLAQVRVRVKQMHAEGCTQSQMCAQLGNMPRPPMAKWRNLTWQAAFRSPLHRDAVKTKLSKLAHAEISKFPR
jgi:hypothetical protein